MPLTSHSLQFYGFDCDSKTFCQIKTFTHMGIFQIKRRFQAGAVTNRADTAGQGELDRDFNFVLSQQMVR